jgi:hypothetical protein
LAEVRCRPCNATPSIGRSALQTLQGTFGNWQRCAADPAMLLPQLAKVRCRPCRALSGIGRGALQTLQCTSGNSRNCPAEAATHSRQFTKPLCSGCNRPVNPAARARRPRSPASWRRRLAHVPRRRYTRFVDTSAPKMEARPASAGAPSRLPPTPKGGCTRRSSACSSMSTTRAGSW